MFLRYSIKISSWLLLTVVSFNFDRYQFSNDLYAYKVRNNASFIIVNPITVDSIIFVGIHFRKLKKNGKLWILTFVVCGILPGHLL
jgi:hypothetical protein